MKYKKLITFIGALTAITVLMSVALTFAQPYQSVTKEDQTNENHGVRGNYGANA